MTVRAVTPEDMPMLEGWAKARECELHPILLSPYGFIAVDGGNPILAVWGFMILDVPVIQLDHLCSRPQTSMPLVREAWAALLSAVRTWIRIINETSGLGYALIRCHFDERLSDEAARSGGVVSKPKQFTAIFHA